MKKVFAALATMSMVMTAQAGFLIQPSVGYDVSSKTSSTSVATGSSYDFTNSGTAYGAMLGYKFGNGILVGADYTAGSGKSKDDATGSTTEYDTTLSAASVIFGFDKNRFSAYLGYGLQDTITLKDTTTTDDKFTGTNFKVGLGFRFVSHVGMSVEYIKPTYTKLTSNGGSETNVSDTYSKLDISTVRVNLTFPFEFGK